MDCLNTTCPPVITTTVTGALGHTHKRFIYIHVFNRMYNSLLNMSELNKGILEVK